MSENPRDGGPAFPRVVADLASNYQAFFGMSLRDYFAAEIIAALIYERALKEQRPNFGWKHDSVYASDAYKMADAMIREREK